MDLREPIESNEHAEEAPQEAVTPPDATVADGALDEALRQLEMEPPAEEPPAEEPPAEEPPAEEPPAEEPPAEEPPAEPDLDAVAELAPAPRARLARSPYVAYAIGWLALAGATMVLLNGTAYPREVAAYRYLALAGVALAALAPVVWLAAWLISRRTAEGRSGLALRSMLWAAVTACGGVLLWWGALTLVDALRFGWL